MICFIVTALCRALCEAQLDTDYTFLEFTAWQGR